MSGGSMNYLYSRVENDSTFDESTPQRKAFAEHLKKVAKALHDIEWVDSGDYGPGDENESIMNCVSNSEWVGELLADLDKLKADIGPLLESVTRLEADLDRVTRERDAMTTAYNEAMASLGKCVDERYEALKDAQMYRTLKPRMLGADFDWNDSGTCVLVFEWKHGVPVGADLDRNIAALGDVGV